MNRRQRLFRRLQTFEESIAARKAPEERRQWIVSLLKQLDKSIEVFRSSLLSENNCITDGDCYALLMHVFEERVGLEAMLRGASYLQASGIALTWRWDTRIITPADTDWISTGGLHNDLCDK